MPCTTATFIDFLWGFEILLMQVFNAAVVFNEEGGTSFVLCKLFLPSVNNDSLEEVIPATFLANRTFQISAAVK